MPAPPKISPVPEMDTRLSSPLREPSSQCILINPSVRPRAADRPCYEFAASVFPRSSEAISASIARLEASGCPPCTPACWLPGCCSPLASPAGQRAAQLCPGAELAVQPGRSGRGASGWTSAPRAGCEPRGPLVLLFALVRVSTQRAPVPCSGHHAFGG